MHQILVIENDRAIRRVIRKILTAARYECVEAPTALEGLRTSFDDGPNLIIIDNQLPDFKGLELCRILKSDKKTQNIPIVIVTGEAVSPKIRADALIAGADDVLFIPFGDTELLARAKGLIDAGAKAVHDAGGETNDA